MIAHDPPYAEVESDLSHIITRLNGLEERIGHDIARVSSVADSVYGPVPSPVSGKASPDKPYGRMQDIGEHLSRLDDLEFALREQIERLGRL